jgi:hypothetical protein
VDKEEREAIRKQQTAELYQSIGRFAVQFEHVTLAMKHTVAEAYKSRGLTEPSLAALAFRRKAAGPLRRLYSEVVRTWLLPPGADGDIQILKAIEKRVDKLIDDRNEALHSTWYVGWGSEDDTDFSKAAGIALGERDKYFTTSEWTAKDFDALADTADEIANLLNLVYAFLKIDGTLAAHFELDGNGAVRNKSQRHGG